MKSKWNILVLLGILMLIAAPAAAYPPTPFLISGWVNDSMGESNRLRMGWFREWMKNKQRGCNE